MSVRERERQKEGGERETVKPENCAHPHPSHFNVTAYVEDMDGVVELELECRACETVVYEVVELDNLLDRKRW